jgi:PAS domain S-box-containing protein
VLVAECCSVTEEVIKVLLVEDEAAYAQLLQEILQELSEARVQVTAAHRLSEAELCLDAGHFDVILLDLSLPEWQGLETYTEAKKLAGAIPIIVLTGSDDETLALEAVRAGAQDYVVKGQFDCRMLLRIIRYAIERKRAEEALREREEFFRLISENVQDLIAVIDRDGRRLYNSPSYRATLGDPAQLAGTNSFQEIHPEDRATVTEIFQQTLRTGVGRRVEYRLLLKDGAVRYIESQGSVIRDAAGEPCKVVLVSRDVTERKETVESLQRALSDLKKSHEELAAAQLQLIHAEKLAAVSTFAAGVAHEVRNPLQAIILGVDYLSHHVVSNDEMATAVLDEMAQAVQKADAIIRGLVEFSACNQREVKDRDLSAIVEQAVRSVQDELAKAPITLVKKLATDLPPLRLDLKTMKHVFIKLLTSAIEAMPDGGTLTVTTSARRLALGDSECTDKRSHLKPGDTIVMAEVEDTGAGILENKVSFVTDTELARRSVRKGSGLGLTVARKIVELYGGSLQIANRPQRGARVAVLFNVQRRPSL